MDFLIGPDNDWVVENGDVVIATNAAFIRQTWLIRMRKFKGEWVLDEDDGVPYVQEIFGKGTKEHMIAVVRRITLDTPGVLTVQNITVDRFDRKNREIDVTVEGFIEGPESFVFRYSGQFASTSQCSITFPLLFENPRLWIDGQDLQKSTFNGSATSVINKAATGYGTGDAPIVSTSKLNSKRSFRFDGTESVEVTDTPAIRHNGMSVTVFAVFKPEITSGGTYGLFTLEGITDTGDYERIMLSIVYISGVFYLQIRSKKTGEVVVSTESVLADGTAAYIVSLTVVPSGGLSLTVNGNQQDFDVPYTVPRHLNGDYTIGAETDDAEANVNFFKGNIGEIIVYESILSTEDINSVTVCLGRKWGINLNPSEVPVGVGYYPYGISAYGL